MSVFEAFEIDSKEFVSFDFVNNHHAPVRAEQLPRLIAQHKNSASFYIEVLLEQPALSLRAEVICVLHCHSNMEYLTSLTLFIGYTKLFEGHRQGKYNC